MSFALLQNEVGRSGDLAGNQRGAFFAVLAGYKRKVVCADADSVQGARAYFNTHDNIAGLHGRAHNLLDFLGIEDGGPGEIDIAVSGLVGKRLDVVRECNRRNYKA
jgi:hypothetical protein